MGDDMGQTGLSGWTQQQYHQTPKQTKDIESIFCRITSIYGDIFSPIFYSRLHQARRLQTELIFFLKKIENVFPWSAVDSEQETATRKLWLEADIISRARHSTMNILIFHVLLVRRKTKAPRRKSFLFSFSRLLNFSSHRSSKTWSEHPFDGLSCNPFLRIT